MAVENETITQINAPPEFIEAEAKLYLNELQKGIAGIKGADLSKVMGDQFIAGQDPLQKRAQELAEAGIGGYQTFLDSAADLQRKAGESAAAAGQFMGPDAYKAFMSPYQQDVINATLQEFDIQSQRGVPGLAANAITAGAFGGGREGVQKAIYGSESDRNRAALQSGLLQQGFTQANQLASQAFGQQQSIAAQQQQLASGQLGLGSAQQGFLGQDVGALQTFGDINQMQKQRELDAQRELLVAQMNQPLTSAQAYGSGIMGLISGYPGGNQQTIQPSSSPSALQTGISAGATLAGLYRAFRPPTTA